MKTLRKVFRIIILSFIIAAAAAGAGMVGVFYPNLRFMDKVITIEQVDKKRGEDENEDERKT